MLKDLKEKVKNISEIVGLISVAGTLVAIITATIYDFGFFSYFSIYMWNLPISTTEILKDAIVVFPKILLTFLLTLFILYFFSFPLYLGVVLLRKVRKIKYKIINKLNKENIKEEDKKEKKDFKELFPIEFLLLTLLPFYIFGIKYNFFIANPFWFFSLLILLFITKYKNKNLQYPLYKWIIGILIFYLINLFCVGIYDANQEVYIQKYNKDTVILRNGEKLNDIKILRVYDKSLLILKLQEELPPLYDYDKKAYFTEQIKNFKLSFLYSTEIDKYYMQNESINAVKRNFLIDCDYFSSINIKQHLKENWWFYLLLLFITIIIL